VVSSTDGDVSSDGSCREDEAPGIIPNDNYAVDVLSAGVNQAVNPEPPPLSLLGVGLLGLAGLRQINKWRRSPYSKGRSA
jgi:hypothetical protein